MPKISLDNLERYDGHLKDWCDARFAERKVHENWHEAGPSGAVSFYPVPNCPIDPVVNFAFTETLPSGNKGPDNPSTITGVSSVKVWRAGDNILPGNRQSNYYGEAGIFSTDSNGYVSYTAMSDGRAFVYSACNAQVFLHAGQQYVLHIEVKTAATSTYRQLQILDENNTAVLTASPGDSDNSHTFTPLHDGMYGVLYKIYDGVYRFSLYLGSTAASFKPYTGTDYTVNLGGTYYGGSVDLSTGTMTVTRQYMVADNNADIVWVGTNFVAWRYPTGRNAVGRAVGTEVCSHFPFSGAWDGSFAHFYATPTSGLYLANPDWTVSTARQYFTDQYNNGTPVTAVYELATPYTVQLTPQQVLSLSQLNPSTSRINTVYSDQQSVLVRYPKSPIITGSELDNAILSLGGD